MRRLKMNFNIFKIIAAIAAAAADGKITREEAKNILLLIFDLFIPDITFKK